MKEVIDTVSVALANGDTENVGNVVMQEVNRTLLSAGVDEVWADKIDNLIVLLFIIGIALLANIICRKIILRVVAKLVKQTKATWDDIVFNHKVMVNVSRMVAPILIYIAIPIAFPEHADSDLLDFLRRLCLIYIIAVFLRFISALFTAVYQVYSEREQYRDLIRENIEYDILAKNNPADRIRLDELVELMLDTVCSKRSSIRIAGDEFPAEVVKSRFLKLEAQHIQYVLDSLKDNPPHIRNIKKYLLAALYNAPLTMENYYAAQINHDLYGRNRGDVNWK